jgi:hypothetical protein
MKTAVLSFTDYTDLQTRLVLLPREDDTGVGAVVSCFVPQTDQYKLDNGCTDKSPQPQRDKTDTYNTSLVDIDIDCEEKCNGRVEETEDATNVSVIGWVLIGILGWENETHEPLSELSLCPLWETDFATILARIRESQSSWLESQSNESLPTDISINTPIITDAVVPPTRSSIIRLEFASPESIAPNNTGTLLQPTDINGTDDDFEGNVAEEKKADDFPCTTRERREHDERSNNTAPVETARTDVSNVECGTDNTVSNTAPNMTTAW